MGQPTPAHIGNMQQPIQSAKVDESTIVGQVLHRPGQHGAFFQGGERHGPLGVLLLFQDLLCYGIGLFEAESCQSIP